MVSSQVWRHYYELFAARYWHRQDAIGIQRAGFSFDVLPGGLTYRRFRRHLNGSSTYAVYNLDDNRRVGFILFDMDVFPRVSRPREDLLKALVEMKVQVRLLLNTLSKFNIKDDQVLVEFPTIGYHVLLFFRKPLPVREAKAFARLAKEQSGLNFKMPFYPHKTRGQGDLVLLPLRRNPLTGMRSNFVRDLARFDPACYDETPDLVPLERVCTVDPETIKGTLEAFNKL